MAVTLEEPITSEAALPGRKLTYDEFLEWALKQEFSYEWVDGEVVPMAPATRNHEELFGFLLILLKTYTQKYKLGRVIGSHFSMKLEKQRRGREPDLLFVSSEREHLLKKTYLDGAADLAIEISSPESVGRDRGDKFVEYEAAGVREYWLIDPPRQQAEFYTLTEAGHYQPSPPDADGIYHSTVISGFRLRVNWLWQLPDELDVLRELGVI